MGGKPSKLLNVFPAKNHTKVSPAPTTTTTTTTATANTLTAASTSTNTATTNTATTTTAAAATASPAAALPADPTPDELIQLPAPLGFDPRASEAFYRYALGPLVYDDVPGLDQTHAFSATMRLEKPKENSPARMKRLARELRVLHCPGALPLDPDASIWLRHDEKKPFCLSALITGPACTPYAHGLFNFDMYCNSSYPTAPPSVLLTTTGRGKVRFNPNLYPTGTVCISLLGTWEGTNHTQHWAKNSTLMQVLVSIQSLIMGVTDPYYNEPGREGLDRTAPENIRLSRIAQNGGWEMIRLYTIYFAIVEQLRQHGPTSPYGKAVRVHCFLKRRQILATAHAWLVAASTSDTLGYYQRLSFAVKELIKALDKLEANPPGPACKTLVAAMAKAGEQATQNNEWFVDWLQKRQQDDEFIGGDEETDDTAEYFEGWVPHVHLQPAPTQAAASGAAGAAGAASAAGAAGARAAAVVASQAVDKKMAEAKTEKSTKKKEEEDKQKEEEATLAVKEEAQTQEKQKEKEVQAEVPPSSVSPSVPSSAAASPVAAPKAAQVAPKAAQVLKKPGSKPKTNLIRVKSKETPASAAAELERYMEEDEKDLKLLDRYDQRGACFCCTLL